MRAAPVRARLQSAIDPAALIEHSLFIARMASLYRFSVSIQEMI
jgi:hypothetical protein